jgi:hypothetical protein
MRWKKKMAMTTNYKQSLCSINSNAEFMREREKKRKKKGRGVHKEANNLDKMISNIEAKEGRRLGGENEQCWKRKGERKRGGGCY